MSVQQSLFKSSSSINNIQKSLNSFGVGLRKANSTSSVIIRGLVEGNREKEKAIRLRLGAFEKRREAVRRREREDVIEAGKINSLGIGKATQKAITSSTQGFLGRIMRFVGTIFIGWLLTNLPRIIEGAEALITKMTTIYNTLRGWVDNTTNFFKNFNISLDGLSGRIFSPQEEDVQQQENKLNSSLKDVDSGVNDMFKDFQKGLENLRNYDLIAQVRDYFSGSAGSNQSNNRNSKPDGPGTGPGGPGGQYGPILNLIGSAEGGYTSIAPNDKNDNLTNMTIAEAANATGENGGRGAIGRYQLTNPINQAINAGLDPEKDLFNEENQDLIAISLIKGRGITPDMIINDPIRAASLLAMEFAGIPVLADQQGYVQSIQRGQSYYRGFGGNKATITPEAVEAAFKKFGQTGKLELSTRFQKGDMVSDIGAPARITSLLGSFEKFRSKPHGGIDIGCDSGLYIALRADCEVVGTKNEPNGYGLVIDVWVPSYGVQLRFAHNSSIIIKSGAIPAGTSFAVTGSTGKSTGPHIHLEATTERGRIAYGSTISPDPYIALIILSAAQIDKKPGQIPDLSGRGGPSLTGTGMNSASTAVSTSKKKGTVVPVPIPIGGQQPQSPGVMVSGGGSDGGTNVVMESGLNSFITNNLLRELEYT